MCKVTRFDLAQLESFSPNEGFPRYELHSFSSVNALPHFVLHSPLHVEVFPTVCKVTRFDLAHPESFAPNVAVSIPNEMKPLRDYS